MGEVKILTDGSLMNEENCLYRFSGKKVDGKPIIPDGVEDIYFYCFDSRHKEIYNEYEGGYYLGSEQNPYKYFCTRDRDKKCIKLHFDTEYICSSAFKDFYGELVFNNKLKGIGEEAFKNACIKNLVVPEGCLKINKGAFAHNYIPPIVHLPNSITYIGKGAFPSYPSERIFASPQVLALIGREHFVAKALEYFKSGEQTPEDDAKWLAEMESFKNPFVTAAIASKNANALLFALSNKLTKKSDYDKIVEVATATQNTALNAAVLGTTAKPTAKEREKKAEKEVEKAIGIRSLSVADIKKLWEYRVDDDGCATLTKYIGSETIPTIPEKIGKAVVKRIGNKAISLCSEVKGIYVPEGIVAIGAYAFSRNKTLTIVEIPESVLVIGEGVYEKCSKLKNATDVSNKSIELAEPGARVHYDYCRLDEIKTEWKYVIDEALNTCKIEKYVGNKLDICIPDAILGAKVTEIGRDCFSSGLSFSGDGSGAQQKRNKKIECINIPESVKSIGESAFAGCKNLKTINIPRGCKVEKYAFLGCEKLAQDGRLIFINDILYRCIDPYAIFGYHGGNNEPYDVVIPPNVKEIAESAFEQCRNLASVLLSSSVTKVNNKAFAECRGLKKITLPFGIVEIGNYAFQECAITEIEIPASVTSLGCGVFFGCMSLERVVIPESVKSIDEDAFRHCRAVVIHAKKGSYAEEFANANDISFEAI